MHFFMMGVSHKTAGVQIREKLSFSAHEKEGVLRELFALPGLYGCVLLDTCNRMEIYTSCNDSEEARQQIIAYLTQTKGITTQDVQDHMYTLERSDVIRHLFEVTSSLDSMVLGDQQIIGQVRQAYRRAVSAGTTTMFLSRLFAHALTCGKRVRTQTAIGQCHVSVSTVAVDAALEVFGDLSGATVLVVGSGEMCTLAARYLHEQGVNAFIVTSLTHSHACALAQELDGRPHEFSELANLLPQADIVITGTSAPHAIIWPQHLMSLDHKLLILDIAMPRDVAPECADNPLVHVVDLDDLNERAQSNQAKRQAATEQARSIIDEEVCEFEAWIEERAVTPAVKELRLWAEEVRKGEVEHLLRVLGADLGPADVEAVNAATNALVKKLVHYPTKRMRQSAQLGTVYETVEAERYLFGFSDDVPAFGNTYHQHAALTQDD